jgi:flagellin
MRDSLEKLASGLKINKAADDASGMIIADSLRSQKMGLGQAAKNANDGISMLQVADGALEESINIIHTIKQKTIQAASDGQTTETRRAIQRDIDKLLDEFDIISNKTSFNGQKLLSGNFTNKHIQVGAYSGETVNLSIDPTQSTKVGHVSISTLEPDDVGVIRMTALSKISGKNIVTNGVDIQFNNDPENGLGAMADEINEWSEVIDIKAIAVIESQSIVKDGQTGADFKINSVAIGNVSTSKNDANGALVKAINQKSHKTGVKASTNSDGKLFLKSIDGRSIEVNGLHKPTVIDNEELTTLGSIKMIRRNFGQYSFTQDTTVITPAKTIITPEKTIITPVSVPLTQVPEASVLNEIPTNTFIAWASASSGSGGGITVTVSNVINDGIMNPLTMTATDPDFISNFFSSFPGMRYRTTNTGPADISSSLVFSAPLPIGSKLFAVDVDQGHTLTLKSNGTPLTLINQAQTAANTSSSFPSYNAATGALSDTGTTNLEATIFDVSNLSSIDLTCSGGSNGKDVFFAISLPNSSPDNPSKSILKEEIIPESIVVTVPESIVTTSKSLTITDTGTLRLCDVDVTGFETSQISMEIADVALQDIDRVKSEIGSVQNQLESTISNITTTMVQVASAESTIRDLDFADESSNYTKLNILLQAGMFAMSQANTSAQNVLSLLQ